MKYTLLLVAVCLVLDARAQKIDVELYTVRGDTIRAKQGFAQTTTQDFVFVKINGKEKEFHADSLIGFKLGNTLYLSMKSREEPHHRFCVKARNFDELTVYGWKDVAIAGNSHNGDTSLDIYRYDYVKRERDERSAVFGFTKEGLTQIPFLNCPAVMDSLLRTIGSEGYEKKNLIELVDAYDRECGVIMRGR